ncbi:hypothetical protein H7J87_18315 [Mycolicibacterium wolinskyi]|uniref:Uncharacterized protein n=1 Tax=Mycolicibacterium wolinskyi TaxID=59750 RepID=A0A1X2EV01_9MYCO|nr:MULTISPECIES: hypothetical protein [Mycolicibacterium]MCV7287279.1 hypothetical protein [Mycolicibacterium wolinskyi]MCV7292772.1 hypothetical protein [Mycolicibacterium goodii]ORX09956.1 hypothetical protein AWC31_07095 [Mycolicibacterium wolinskyi]
MPTVGQPTDQSLPTDLALQLDRATNLADLARGDLSRAMHALPANSSLWLHVDIVRAIGHLRAAAVLVDKIADQLDTAEVVNR